MLKFKVVNQVITLEEVVSYGDPLVANSDGDYECVFEFDQTWEGFTKTAVFLNTDSTLRENQTISSLVLLEKDKCLIPKSVLRPDSYLRVGVYGTKDFVERPTIYAPSLLVRVGASPDDNIPDPDQGIYLQIICLVEETKAIAQEAKAISDTALKQSDINTASINALDKKIPTKVSQLENDSKYMTELKWNE